MRQAHVADGVPSHWTPYIGVNDVDTVARRAGSIGGKVLVQPFEVDGIARIALILDSVGAHVGLWESLETNKQGVAHG
jgi:predicted enzyme related to lactoylglutathione lyase